MCIPGIYQIMYRFCGRCTCMNNLNIVLIYNRRIPLDKILFKANHHNMISDFVRVIFLILWFCMGHISHLVTYQDVHHGMFKLLNAIIFCSYFICLSHCYNSNLIILFRWFLFIRLGLDFACTCLLYYDVYM
jgi:hypothetical protein